ncbi:MAG: ferrous iron transport protein A [Oscillospiraceae bacterium]|nr:ferrous iron transport protein A [Oscillospiraceae bacterium]
MFLDNISVGKTVKIIKLLSTGIKRKRLLDLGFIKGTKVSVLNKSPFGNPVAYLLRGAVIALRKEDAKNILVLEF